MATGKQSTTEQELEKDQEIELAANVLEEKFKLLFKIANTTLATTNSVIEAVNDPKKQAESLIKLRQEIDDIRSGLVFIAAILKFQLDEEVEAAVNQSADVVLPAKTEKKLSMEEFNPASEFNVDYDPSNVFDLTGVGREVQLKKKKIVTRKE